MNLFVKKLTQNAKLPVKAKSGDAGYDLFATEYTIINPGERKLISTGIAVEIPYGYYGRIAPRSGLALKSGIDVLGGVVDCGYHGEVGVILINLNLPSNIHNISDKEKTYSSLFGDANKFVVKPGDRIAQIIIEQCLDLKVIEVNELEKTERGECGFGSTGTS